jgi:hypothetical protein
MVYVMRMGNLTLRSISETAEEGRWHRTEIVLVQTPLVFKDVVGIE